MRTNVREYTPNLKYEGLYENAGSRASFLHMISS